MHKIGYWDGGVLMQNKTLGYLQSIYFASKAMTKIEKLKYNRKGIIEHHLFSSKV